MTTELVNYYACGKPLAPHHWRYRGKEAQAYICMACQLTVTKRDLKEATD